MMSSIRVAGIEHIHLIKEITAKTWPVAYGDILSPAQIQYMLNLFYSEASLQEQMQEKQHQFIVVFDNDAAAGFASYSPKSTEEPTIYRLHKIYIHPNHQGKGAGKVLLNYIINDITSNNAAAMELNVNRHNKALHFYQKLGFEIIKEEDIDIGNGYFMNDYVMRKVL
jgi:diamine N-acetyltransferase